MSENHCSHHWLPLYQEPTDSAFLKIYEASGLDSFFQCQTCKAIAKKKDGAIRQLPRSKWRLHVTRSRQWSNNIRTFVINQGGSHE